MINLGPHSAFILGSYLACAAILGGLTIWIILDNRARKRELAELDGRRHADHRR